MTKFRSSNRCASIPRCVKWRDVPTRLGRALTRSPLPKPAPPHCSAPSLWLACAGRQGWVAERFKAPVLKTGELARVPWVRIPPHPPISISLISLAYRRHLVTREVAVCRAIRGMASPILVLRDLPRPPVAPGIGALSLRRPFGSRSFGKRGATGSRVRSRLAGGEAYPLAAPRLRRSRAFRAAASSREEAWYRGPACSPSDRSAADRRGWQR
jgi:hypothetical protein